VGGAMVATDSQVPWFPESLRGQVDPQELLEGFSYVVLEEIVDEAVLLLAWPWPVADRDGRLRWDTAGTPAEAIVDRAELRARLYQPAGLRREPRCGDTFAAEGAGRQWPQPAAADLAVLLPGRVFDLTPDAREAAKLAHLGSVAPVHAATPRVAAALEQAQTARSARQAPQVTIEPATGGEAQEERP
jgi:hypothetical protein